MTIWNMEITSAESPQTVHIPIEGKYYAIKNTGEHDILVSSYVTNPTEGADDVMKIPSGSAAIIPVKDGALYVSAEEDGSYSISIQDDKVIPWSGGTGSGGGGGDNIHYKGTTTTALENGSTTNPITIDGESYTAVFGDVVVYGYTEFVFDGTAWSEFGRPFDTVPTRGSTNAVTSDGIYKHTPLERGEGNYSVHGGYNTSATRSNSFAYGSSCNATGLTATAFGSGVLSNQTNMFACGSYNSPRTGDLFNIGRGASPASRSNIVEINYKSANVNGNIRINNVSIPTPYTTMPTIVADMLGQIAMYVGASDSNYKQGCFYIAATDGAAEPTYSWVKIGGGRTETVLYTNAFANDPETSMLLSDSYTNYDSLCICLGKKGSMWLAPYPICKSLMSNDAQFGLSDEVGFANITLTDATHITRLSATSGYGIYKIIGIKY